MFTDSTDKGNQLQRRNLNQKFVSYTKGGCRETWLGSRLYERYILSWKLLRILLMPFVAYFTIGRGGSRKF